MASAPSPPLCFNNHYYRIPAFEHFLLNRFYPQPQQQPDPQPQPQQEKQDTQLKQQQQQQQPRNMIAADSPPSPVTPTTPLPGGLMLLPLSVKKDVDLYDIWDKMLAGKTDEDDDGNGQGAGVGMIEIKVEPTPPKLVVSTEPLKPDRRAGWCCFGWLSS